VLTTLNILLHFTFALSATASKQFSGAYVFVYKQLNKSLLQQRRRRLLSHAISATLLSNKMLSCVTQNNVGQQIICWSCVCGFTRDKKQRLCDPFFAFAPKPIAPFRWNRASLSLFRPQPHLPSLIQIYPSFRDLLAKTTFQIVAIIGGSPIIIEYKTNTETKGELS